MARPAPGFSLFFFNDTATTEIYTLSLHDALPICDEKQFSVSPAEAYGEHDPQLVQKVPKEIFPKDTELAPGLLFEAGLPTGEKIPATVTAIEENTVSVDLNHPLAGKKLNFKIKLTEITSSNLVEKVPIISNTRHRKSKVMCDMK